MTPAKDWYEGIVRDMHADIAAIERRIKAKPKLAETYADTLEYKRSCAAYALRRLQELHKAGLLD